MSDVGNGLRWRMPVDVIDRIRRHLSCAWTRLVRPSRVRVGDVVIGIDPYLMPTSLIRAVLRGDYELPERNAVVRMLRPGDRVAEFGGGVGVVSMTAAKITGPGTVHVFEPQPVACDLIRRNAKLNGLEIDCSNVAVAGKSGTRTFYTNSNIISSNLFGGRKGGKGRTAMFEVDAVAIGDILKTQRPNVIISDIEGAEVEVLGGCDLTGIDVIVIEMHPHVVGTEAIAALEAHFRTQGLVSIPALRSLDTQAFTRGRQPAF